MPTNGAPVAKSVSLGTRQVAFDGIETGRKVKVQLATVVGGHVVSDILEQTINQSLAKAVLHDRFHAGDGH